MVNNQARKSVPSTDEICSMLALDNLVPSRQLQHDNLEIKSGHSDVIKEYILRRIALYQTQRYSQLFFVINKNGG